MKQAFRAGVWSLALASCATSPGGSSAPEKAVAAIPVPPEARPARGVFFDALPARPADVTGRPPMTWGEIPERKTQADVLLEEAIRTVRGVETAVKDGKRQADLAEDTDRARTLLRMVVAMYAEIRSVTMHYRQPVPPEVEDARKRAAEAVKALGVALEAR